LKDPSLRARKKRKPKKIKKRLKRIIERELLLPKMVIRINFLETSLPSRKSRKKLPQSKSKKAKRRQEVRKLPASTSLNWSKPRTSSEKQAGNSFPMRTNSSQ